MGERAASRFEDTFNGTSECVSGPLTSAGASASSGAQSLSETGSSSLPIPSAQSLPAFAVLLGLGGRRVGGGIV